MSKKSNENKKLVTFLIWVIFRRVIFFFSSKITNEIYLVGKIRISTICFVSGFFNYKWFKWALVVGQFIEINWKAKRFKVKNGFSYQQNRNQWTNPQCVIIQVNLFTYTHFALSVLWQIFDYKCFKHKLLCLYYPHSSKDKEKWEEILFGYISFQ